MRRLVLVIVASMVAVAACPATAQQLGRPPAVDRLGELQSNVSTTNNIVAVLGEPQGRGVARLTSLPAQDVWLYESAQTDGSKVHARMLIVFIDPKAGTYQGYLWFAGGQVLRKTQ